MQTCTWAPTTFAGTKVVKDQHSTRETAREMPTGDQLTQLVATYVARLEDLGLSHILIAQRWWGNAKEIEGSSLDCLAMTSYIAACTSSIQMVTAIHPGFFHPSVIAKWAATLDNLTKGRWSINVTSGWNMEEFSMYGIDPLTHDERYKRSSEFIDVLRGAWQHPVFDYQGEYYQVKNLVMQPRPTGPLEVFQGGQSDAAIRMACHHSDWMFLNGGSLDKIQGIIKRVRSVAEEEGRCPRFAVYGIPICRETDAEAYAVIDNMISNMDPAVLAKRKERVSGAEGMWANADKLGMLDTNEGYSTGLIGAPDTILEQIRQLNAAGVDMLHLALGDKLFEQEVLPLIHAI
ncbi:MAG: LLM class flavin-dependent oxidoreductase [bacterium]